MPRAGRFDYPSRDLDDCVSYLRRAREALKARVMTRDGFAEAIGQSPRGGGFGKLVGAMAAYGLIETGKNRVATTDLAEQLLYGSLDEQRAGRERSVRSVRLFSELYRKFGKEPTDDQLRLFLRDKAGIEIASAKSAADEVGKLLRRNAVHLPSEKKSATQAEASPPSELPGELVGRLEMADYGILNIRDEISMDLAISLLTQVKKVKSWSAPGKSAGHDEEPVEKRASDK